MSHKISQRSFWAAQTTHLREHFIDRETQTRALQLAVLSGEHAFLLGPPGAGKSSFVRGFMACLQGRYFEHSLSRTRVDSAVLGPVNIPLLRDTGQLQRQTRGYLLDCDWAFLDEIAQVSPELGYDLHAALNERIYHEVVDGRSSRPIPLRTAVTSANTLPHLNRGADGDDGRALWDRLLVRAPVDYLHRRDDARRLLDISEADNDITADDVPLLDLKSLDQHQDALRRLPLSPEIVDTCLNVRETLHDTGDVFSDRRWRASMRVLQASAWLRADDLVTLDDVEALTFTLWDTLDQRTRVHRHIVRLTDPDEAERLEILDIAALLSRTSRDYDNRSGAARQAWQRECTRKLRYLRDRTNQLQRRWRSEEHTKLSDVFDALDAVEHMIDSLQDDSRAVRSERARL